MINIKSFQATPGKRVLACLSVRVSVACLSEGVACCA